MRLLTFLIFLFVFSTSPYANTQFLAITDIHYGDNNTSKAGEDTGKDLLQLSMNKVAALSQHTDFMLYLGDLPTHAASAKEKEHYEQTVFQALYQADRTKQPLFYVSGNNDSLRGNYQPFSGNGMSPLQFASGWNGACAHCEQLILDKSAMYTGGYYASYVIPNNRQIMLIALNTAPFATVPFLLRRYPNQEQDAAVQLRWLEKILQNHSAKQLIIAMHIPPGQSYLGRPLWHPRHTDAFITILSKALPRYQQISLIASHTHMDGFRKLAIGKKHAVYLYSVPSVSRVHYNHPALKTFTLNNQLQLQNITTYYTPLAQAWGEDSYDTQTYFAPLCHHQALVPCLNTLSPEALCQTLEQHGICGVKSPRVASFTQCCFTYLVERTTPLEVNTPVQKPRITQ